MKWFNFRLLLKDGVFEDCINLENLTISIFTGIINTSSVWNCSKLKKIGFWFNKQKFDLIQQLIHVNYPDNGQTNRMEITEERTDENKTLKRNFIRIAKLFFDSSRSNSDGNPGEAHTNLCCRKLFVH